MTTDLFFKFSSFFSLVGAEVEEVSLPLGGGSALPSAGGRCMCASEERDVCAGSPAFFLRCCHFPGTAMKIRGLFSIFSVEKREFAFVSSLPLGLMAQPSTDFTCLDSPSLRHA